MENNTTVETEDYPVPASQDGAKLAARRNLVAENHLDCPIAPPTGNAADAGEVPV
jgi:hypothetical protein